MSIVSLQFNRKKKEHNIIRHSVVRKLKLAGI